MVANEVAMKCFLPYSKSWWWTILVNEILTLFNKLHWLLQIPDMYYLIYQILFLSMSKES